VVIGQPNVGKSSLFNQLAGQERAIVSPHPGTTRDTIEATVEIAGVPVTLFDTAGLHDQPGEVEALGIARTRNAVDTADALLLVTEAPRPLDAAEHQMIDSANRPLILILNKTDLMSDPPAAESALGVPVSALTGAGLEDLWHALEGLIDQLLPRQGEEPQVLLSAFQEEQIRQLREALERAVQAHDREEPEIIAEDIRHALAYLGRLRGTSLTPDLIGEIFSRFCVGK
jgi:tRNA modification GTPase